MSSIATKLNKFIFPDVSVLRNVSFAHDFIEGVFLHLGHKVDSLGSPLGKETVVIIGAVINDHSSGGKGDLAGNPDIRDFPFRNPCKGRKVAVMVQEKMEFDGSFGLAEESPVKKADRQINEGRVQADELIFEPELFLSDSFALEAGQKR